jgi:non-canonical (house-cleaning) NTP pyrophosphatase
MPKFIIALGTSSGQKIGYLKEVLQELGIEAELIANDVKSGISEQPMTSRETKRGSVNRAKEALMRNPRADFALGIEVGYHTNKEGKYEIFCWATVSDNAGDVVSKESHRFLLPKFHQEVLKNDLYLGDYVKDYFKTSSHPIVQHVAEMVRGRKPFITNAIKHALIFYISKKEF